MYISTKYKNRHITCILPLIFKVCKSRWYRALIIRLFFVFVPTVTQCSTQSAVSSATGVRVVAERLRHTHRHGIHTRLAHLVMTSPCCLQTDESRMSHDLVVFRWVDVGTCRIIDVVHLTQQWISLISLTQSRHCCQTDELPLVFAGVCSMTNWHARLPVWSLTRCSPSLLKNSLLAQDLSWFKCS